MPHDVLKIAARLFNETPSAEELWRRRNDLTEYINQTARNRRGEPLQDNAFSRVFDKIIPFCFENGINVNMAGPPGIGKSTRARKFFEQQLGKDPLKRLVILSSTESLAGKIVAAMRKTMQDDGRFRMIFPGVQIDDATAASGSRMGNTKNCFYLKDSGADPDPACEAVAVITDEEMRRVDMALFDDIVGGEIANSPTKRDHVCNAFFETWINGRLKSVEGRGWACCIQNVYHKRDLAHRLLENSDFMSIWFGVTDTLDAMFVRVWNAPDDLPVIDDMMEVAPQSDADMEFHIPLPDVEDFMISKLQRTRDSDRTLFRRKYQLIAAGDEDRMFAGFDKRTIYPGTVGEAMGLDSGSGTPQVTLKERRRFLFGWGYDISSSVRPGDVLFLGAVDRLTHRLYPVEIHMGNSWRISQVIDFIENARTRGFEPSFIRVENNGVQEKIVDEIRTEARRRSVNWSSLIQAHTTGRNKASAEMGLPALNLEFEQGNFIWPAKEAEKNPTWRTAESQFEICPRFPRPGETPDIPMAVWFFYWGARENGLNHASQRQGNVEVIRTSQRAVNW